MFDFFARHKIPDRESVRDVHFTTVNPGLSSRCHWLSIEAQQPALLKSVVSVRYDPGQRRFVGTTENVARLALDLSHVRPGGPITAQWDGQKIEGIREPDGERRIWFQRTGDRWKQTGQPSPALKGPHRSGPFKEAFSHRMMFVYGIRGTAAENAWALAKARFDAETFWYRGNGSIDIVSDRQFDPDRDRERSVILYGHADSNGTWASLLADSPVQVRRGWLRLGRRELRGDDLACLFLRPRPGSDRACVAAVSGTGLVGLRLTERASYFVAGVAYPDCTVFGADTLTKGNDGVRVAGFFGNDWSVEAGEFVWRE
jgi:hypothetical protein